jgi:citrate lyase subunit beta/citryl-CoA lyase
LYAARVAGIHAIDTIYPNVQNEEGFLEEVRLIKQLGFDGKSVIQPNQIKLVHRIYTPTVEDIRKALRIVAAIKEAETKGSGVIALDGRMVDKPIVERAQWTLELARASGIVPEEVGV